MKTREQKIEAMLEDWLDSISSKGGDDTVKSLLMNGWKGYTHMTDAEVDEEYLTLAIDHDED